MFKKVEKHKIINYYLFMGKILENKNNMKRNSKYNV